jgi:hypothetical protein
MTGSDRAGYNQVNHQGRNQGNWARTASTHMLDSHAQWHAWACTLCPYGVVDVKTPSCYCQLMLSAQVGWGTYL